MRYQNPAYTGRNRCWPCTGLNLGLTALAAGVLAAVGHPVVAALVAVAGAIVVGVRGYLVPGTPELTRELPESLLNRFGKTEPVAKTDSVESLPATEALLAAGVLDDDLTLSAGAAERISGRAETLVADRETLEATVRDGIPAAVEISARRSLGGGENWFVHDADETTIRQWEARPTAAIDAASIEHLSETLSGWDARSKREQTTMLALCRYGVPACPTCGAEFAEPDGPKVACCGGRSLVGERRCETCGYALVDRNDLPADAEEDDA